MYERLKVSPNIVSQWCEEIDPKKAQVSPLLNQRAKKKTKKLYVLYLET